jgi:hypothetical protein
VGLSDLLEYFSKYGPAGVIIAILLFVIGVLYLQQVKNFKERLAEANERNKETTVRADRFENEVKALNDEIQKYLALGIAARTVMGDAANEMRRLP